MQFLSTNQIRTRFLNYFCEHQHALVPSSSLIPDNDPTLLFVNAGMVQFKNVFLGLDKRDYSKATSSQKCVRAGGKHNDLENVGYTARHHTFFEMLGNFSFGDYFKQKAIAFAWNFLTKELSIPPEKLWVTVFHEDKESEHIWLNEIKIDPKQFSRCGEKDNFWSMGETGPCGPCTEIFYDHGPEVAGGPPGSPDEDGDRYIEIWNLVFMQYNRDANGQMAALPKPCVDTGMGLERIAAVLQGVHSNYEIDSFQVLLKALSQIIGVDDLKAQSMRVIVDHIRSVSFLILDGVVPGNEGRGYVLRRIIRRAVRHGYKLGQENPFFSRLVSALAKEMGETYPELRERQSYIEQIILHEEKQFAETLYNGLKILDQEIENLTGTVLPGAVIFKLYDTYGFPPDLTADILREKSIHLDRKGFEACMQKQRTLSKQASQFHVDYNALPEMTVVSEFLGYETLSAQAKVVELYTESGRTQQLVVGEQGIVVLDRTPFYAESGGQVGDKGLLFGQDLRFVVTDTQKHGNSILHFGVLEEGVLLPGAVIHAVVEVERADIARNHSATHLLHAALKSLLGSQVEQSGSCVSADRLRLDFTHEGPVSFEQLQAIENLVNHYVRENVVVKTDVLPTNSAKDRGVVMLFGEKYGDEVRVLTMGSFSVEACGGTHVSQTGDIGLFKIVSQAAAAAGIRRIEAVTGQAAIDFMATREKTLYEMALQLKVSIKKLPEKLQSVLQESQAMQKQLKQVKSELAKKGSDDLLSKIKNIADVHVLIEEVIDADRETLRHWVDDIKSKYDKSVVLLATKVSGKVQLISGVSQNITDKIKAPDVLQQATNLLAGKGGGRPDMAQGAGENPAELTKALKIAESYVLNRLGE